MTKLKLFLSLLLSFSFCLSAKTQTTCPAGQKQVVVQVKTDDFAFENSFVLKNSSGDTILTSPLNVLNNTYFAFNDSLYSDTICVDENECLTFIINDRGENGICCNGLKEGYYKILIDNELQAEGAEFDVFDVAFINCKKGMICEKAAVISEGIYETPIGNGNNWYEFTTDTSGLFKISTCFPENTCNTTIWAYNFCNPLNEFSTVQGALFYNDDACGLQAETTARLLKGDTYYFRIGSAMDDCRDQPIKWELEFLNPISGCTDTLACNFSPSATNDDGSCLYGGHPDCPAGPDLVMDQQAFERTLQRAVYTDQKPCLREEGCLNGYGTRVLIRFETKIINEGEKDFFIGAPPTDLNDTSLQWEYDECHSHWHYEGYARYLLFDEDGMEIPVGFKNGFCVFDLDCPLNIPKKYSCQMQGLTAGCSDTYERSLDCQWIDITELPVGKYTLVSVVNWEHSPDATGSYETNYANNWGQVCIEIFRDSMTNFTTFEQIADCETYVDCLGTPNGTAMPDCEGNCNGTIKKGDIVRDDKRDLEDVNTYITGSISDDLEINDCNDLNFDGKINVADAALILECFLHEGNPNQPGHSHAPCDFTYTIENPFDSVWLRVGRIDVSDQFVDIEYLAPYGKLEAFELELENVKINGVRSLIPDFNVTIEHDDTEILGLSFEEKALEKTIEFQPFLRVFLDDYQGDTICIANVEALLNENLELMNFVGSECNSPNDSNTKSIVKNDFYSMVIPNPFNGSGQLVFENDNRQPVRIDFFSLSGKRLKTVTDFRANTLLIENGDLPSGVVVYRIVKEDGISVGKVISE